MFGGFIKQTPAVMTVFTVFFCLTLPCWYTSRVDLQGNLWGLCCKRQTGHVNVQRVHLVLDVGGQLMPSLL